MDIDTLTKMTLSLLEKQLQKRKSLKRDDINDILMRLWEGGLNNYGLSYVNASHNRLQPLKVLFKELKRIVAMIENGNFDSGYIDVY